MNIPPELIKEAIETKVAFLERMGIRVLELEPGHVKIGAPLKGNENHIGSMYAGALFSIAEMPLGALYIITFDTSKYYPIVKELTIKFLKPARSDVSFELTMSEEEVARIEAETEEKGKSEFIVRGEVKDESGQVVAASNGVYQLRKIGI
jgi:thioesterase domain-containing protein